MKIGILTFPNSVSYGATLQMYALYRTVEKLGAKPEIINYQNVYMKAERHTNVIREASSANKKLRLAARRILHYRQFQKFRSFERQMRLYPSKAINEPDRLSQLNQRYDGVICGSDQVWNPLITGEDISYFLNFCEPDTKRISYAPSFGIEELPEDFQTKITRELKRFDSVSVREHKGACLLRKMLGREVPMVLDPTFLIGKEEWIGLERAYPAAKGDYILYFTVFGSETLRKFCLELAEKTGRKVVVVGGNVLRQLRNKNSRIEYAWDLSPGQWLYLVHNASCVVTNSFHGTAFSIHYQKEFFVEPAPSANSRLEQILHISGLEDRVVGGEMFDPESAIDYEKVWKRLAPDVEKSLTYLRESIKE